MPTNESIIQGVESFGASISIIACLYMAYKIRQEGSANIANRMLSFLFLLDFLLAIAYVIGRAALPIHGLCQFQALLIQWFSVAAILWAVLMAHQMREWVVEKKHPKRIDSAMQSYMMVIVAVSFILAIVLLGTSVYGEAYLWCWITPHYAAVRFVCFDLILFAAWALIAFYLWEVSASIHHRLKRSSVNVRVLELLAGQTSMQRRLILYVTIFFVIWFFAILNRLLEWGTGDTIFATALIQAVVLPLQGFLNALAFTDALGWLSYIGIGDQTADKFVLNKEIKPTSQLREVMIEPPKTDVTAKRSSTHTQQIVKKYVPKQYSVFCTTLNMGEAPLSTMLPDLGIWILPGHDVYAVGLQECLDLTGVGLAIQNLLGGPSQYSMYSTAIGSGNTTLGYHGYIALMLFVKVSELKAGTIVPTVPAGSTMATGADLIVTTAQNKGAVGLPLQIHDTNICFVTCHLPSDSKGKSKLTKRNASAHAILRGLALAPEDVGFDLHLQHDHVMVFGDMNYRMDSGASGGGMGSLSGVAVACLIEKSAMGDDEAWHARRYNLMRCHTDPLFPSIDEMKILKAARNSSRGAWSSVLRADELRSIMSDGDAFLGFEEPMPCFPPSYKRKKGDIDGDCGDYTDPLQIIQGYTNTGEVQELDVSRLSEAEVVQAKQKIAAKKLRPPSYTDRVLVHSLPDRIDRLTVQSYDFCDRLRVSDHRAVSMTVRLEVNAAVNFTNHAPVTTGATSEKQPDPATEPKFQLYELSITGLHVTLDSVSSTPGKPGEASESEESSSEGEGSDGSRMSRSQDSADDHTGNHYVEFAKENAKRGSLSPPVTTTNNPLLGAGKLPRPASGRGVSFAENGPPRVSFAEPDSKSDSKTDGKNIEMSPTSSRNPSTASSPAATPSASPSPSPSPSPARPGMLSRSKSANSAALNSTNTADTTRTSTASADGDGAEPAKPRFLARMSLKILGPPLATDGSGRISQSGRVSDASLSRSLVKNRNRSIFGVFSKNPEPPVDESGDIINELSRDSLAWEGDSHETGQWKKRVQQEEAERRAAKKKRGAKIVSKIKKNKKLKKNDKKIDKVVVVFPLPSKDPLLAHRKLYDFAQAYNLRGDGADLESNLGNTESHKNVTKEELLRPLSAFPWVEDASSGKSRPGSLKKKTDGSGGGEGHASAGEKTEAGNGEAGAGSGSGKVGSKAANAFKVTGCASPELGAHVLLKFLNRSGFELGSTVVTLSHLLHTSTEEVHATQFNSVAISSGGQQRGTISGKFSLKYLPSLVSGEST